MLNEIRSLLVSVLNTQDLPQNLVEETPLLGHFPELDSMAVVSIITAIEEQYEIDINDDEISAETFETVGSLMDFIREKRV